MALRNARPLTWRPKGVTDSQDGSNSFPGAMTALTNLVPSPGTRQTFVCRPAATQATAFAGFTTPAGGTALLVVGDRIYGMISSADFSGKDVPFCYDTVAGAFVAISGEAAGNLPDTQPTSGDWTPPTMDVIGSYILVTHPGFPGGATKFGWLDMTSFSIGTLTADTDGTAVLKNVSTDPIIDGVQPGNTISGTNIPAGSRVVSLTSTTITIDNATTGASVGVTLSIAGGSLAAPLWGAGDLNVNPLAATPLAVKNFNGRAYFAVGAGVEFSDSSVPLNRTNASQALTFDNGLDVTALGALPLNATSGGIIQSLIAFQGDSNMVQITGDPALNNLAKNNLGIGVGTQAPNTICPTPKGLAFISQDGLRIVNFLAQVSDPIGAHGEGVTLPFINAVSASRMCAAFNENVLRISVQNGSISGVPVQEWWYDFNLQIWTGPHTFPASMIQPFQGTPHGFVMFANGINGKLWNSQAIPDLTSVYAENGSTLTWSWETVLLPDNQAMEMNCIIESTVMMSLEATSSVTVIATDDAQSQMDSVMLSGSSVPAAVWGSFTWGAATWGDTGVFNQRQIPWHNPLVFKQGTIRMTGNSGAATIIGNLYLRYQILGYMLERAS